VIGGIGGRAVAASAAVLAAAGMGWAILHPSELPVGPLDIDPAHGSLIAADHGAVFTDGLEVIQVRVGDHTYRIDGISLTGAEGLTMVDALVAPPPSMGLVQHFPTFPPEPIPGVSTIPNLIPAEGATFRADGRNDSGLELFLGMRVVGDGRHFREGIRVDYTDLTTGEHFSAVLPAEWAVCHSPTGETKECDPKERAAVWSD